MGSAVTGKTHLVSEACRDDDGWWSVGVVVSEEERICCKRRVDRIQVEGVEVVQFWWRWVIEFEVDSDRHGHEWEVSAIDWQWELLELEFRRELDWVVAVDEGIPFAWRLVRHFRVLRRSDEDRNSIRRWDHRYRPTRNETMPNCCREIAKVKCTCPVIVSRRTSSSVLLLLCSDRRCAASGLVGNWRKAERRCGWEWGCECECVWMTDRHPHPHPPATLNLADVSSGRLKIMHFKVDSLMPLLRIASSRIVL